jgi:glycerate 2-kinase
MNLKTTVLAAFTAGVYAADPAAAVQAAIRVNAKRLGFLRDPLKTDSTIRWGDWQCIHIVAFGKAAVPMAQSAVQCIPGNLISGKPLVITSYENVVDDDRLDIRGAAHPVPDMRGQGAANSLLGAVEKAGANELVLALVSGGASALLPLPVAGITLQDKIQATEILLASGADIKEINCVRKHLSQLKGGQLARISSPADVHSLILSDVLGDDLSSIASGPTVPDETTFEDAVAVFERYDCFNQLPASVRSWLKEGCQHSENETPDASDSCFLQTDNSLVCSNYISLQAVRSYLSEAGFQVEIFSESLTGEARDVARQLAQRGAELSGDRPVALIAGGETTVTLKGSGKGGRNQEMALAFALHSEKCPPGDNWVFLSAGTDGIDGPTDAAGGIVDAQTLHDIQSKGIDAVQCLDNNDAYNGLNAAGALINTGATGTNVADLQIFLKK